MEEYIYVNGTDKNCVNAIYRILLRCGLHMLGQGLFHWIKPYPKRAIATDCDSNKVVLVKDTTSGKFTSTFQMSIKSNNILHVRKIATDPHFEGKGIGKKNMRYMEDYASVHGCTKISLDVYKKSMRAVNFYKKCGFVIVGETKARFFSEYIMEKVL